MTLLHSLVDKVVVHEKEYEEDAVIMKVEIYYRFIGNVGDEVGDDLKILKLIHRRWAKKPEYVYPENEK